MAIEHSITADHDGDMTAKGFTDIRLRHWTLRLLPAWARPYGRLARWDRPIGWWLLLFPCWWSLGLTFEVDRCWPTGLPAPRCPYPRLSNEVCRLYEPAVPCPTGSLSWDLAALTLFGLFLLGAIAMRGAGCTWNDILDRKIDAQVERTRDRPLPAGEATVGQAVVWGIAQAAIGAIVLFSFNLNAIVVGLASLLIVAIYPLMKRVTSWPQVILGLAFNWGALLGWTAVRGQIEWPAVALYIGGVAWTLVYDTIYAMQDQRDDFCPASSPRPRARKARRYSSPPAC